MLSTRSLLCVAAVFGLGCGSGCGSDDSFIVDGPDTRPLVPLNAQWELILDEEFEGARGETLGDPWIYEVGTDWGNAQLEFDTDRPENASLDGEGHLVITARKESMGGKDYTSARLKTQDTFSATYGRFEARMKMPKGQGMWPAFWLLGTNINQENVGWPKCGEIDIVEFRGQNPSELRGSLHGPGYSGTGNVGHDFESGKDLTEDFHVYSATWTDAGVSFELDGKIYFTALRANIEKGSEWVFDHPFFIILNLAVGGNYVGSPDANTTFPQELVVDYVKVYQLKK